MSQDQAHVRAVGGARITPRAQPEVYQLIGQQPLDVDSEPQAAALLLAFAPLHKRALGIAFGVACALMMFLLTIVDLLRDTANQFPLTLLSEYFFGYSESLAGAFVGAAWGFFVGFVAGWFVAFCRNLAVALSIFAIRTRAELVATREFLDHI
jgi:hypothetical protein